MAGFFQQLLQGTKNGFLESPYLKDYSHASKTFTTNGFGNAPKFKYLFHVYFDINTNFISDSQRFFPETTNHGLMVKSIDLPKFTIPLTEMNQYNRKRYIQTKINYDPVRIVFHDDNLNQIRNLWIAYYSYYFNDPSKPNNLNSGINQRTLPEVASTALNKRNIYSPLLPGDELGWGYLGETGHTSAGATTGSIKYSFFKSIKIFGFNQHNFALYQLINPMIESFSHDNYNYSEGSGTMENSMSLKYESVKYFEGAMNGQNPGQVVDRFGESGVYDKDLSPIARNGSNRNILGQGGLVDGANGILNDVTNGNILGALQTAGRLKQTFKNPQQILQAAKTELVQGAVSAITNAGTARTGFLLPGLGSTNGPKSQGGSATNSTATTPAPIVARTSPPAPPPVSTLEPI